MEILLIGGLVVAIVFSILNYLRRKRRERLLSIYGDADLVDRLIRGEIWQGMTESQLIESWGRPIAKDEKLYKTKTTEIFKYHQKGKNRFGSRVRVENGLVVGWEKK